MAKFCRYISERQDRSVTYIYHIFLRSRPDILPYVVRCAEVGRHYMCEGDDSFSSHLSLAVFFFFFDVICP